MCSLNSTPEYLRQKALQDAYLARKKKDRFLQRHLRPVGKPGADP